MAVDFDKVHLHFSFFRNTEMADTGKSVNAEEPKDAQELANYVSAIKDVIC